MSRKDYLLHALLIAAVLAAIVAAYPHLPARVPTHWGFNLKPNRYSPKWFLFLLGPGMMAGIMLFTCIAPWLSPKQFNVGEFRSTYCQLMLLAQAMLTYSIAIILWVGLGHRIDTGRAVIGGVCVLFAAMGNLLGKVRRNFFIGIRTPWTLGSEKVWYATHRFAARAFVLAGLLGLVLSAIGLRRWPVYALLCGALAPTIYSLVVYKQLERRGSL
jgi:uncharacterized membrane protein